MSANVAAINVTENAPLPVLPPPLHQRRLQIHLLAMLTDGAMLLTGFALSTFLYLGDPYEDTVWGSAQIILPLYWTVALLNRTYSQSALVDPMFGFRRATLALALSGLLVVMILFLARSSLQLSRVGFSLGCLWAWLLIAWARYNLVPVIRHWLGPRAANVLVIDDGGPRTELPDAFRIVAVQAGLAPSLDDPHWLDRLAAIVAPMDRIVVSCPPERREAWAMVLKGLNASGEVVDEDVVRLGIFATLRTGDVGTLVVATGPLGIRARVAKRLFDLVVAASVLVALAVPMLLVGFAIRLADGGPALFRQRRVGRNNRFFTIYKFRTMRAADEDCSGTQSAQRTDARVTRLGRFLRRTSFDELPQLFNVLRGEMSLVGPRPHALGSHAGDKLFWEVDRRYWQRHALKPGMSGLAQIRGFRGATDQEADLANRLQADLEYQAGWSLWRDLAIIGQTLRILAHDRAY